MSLDLAFLIAQSPELVPGQGAGWAGAGLLGLVLAWLMFKHLPDQARQLSGFMKAKDDQINDFIRSKDERIANITANLEKRIDNQRQEFTAALASITASFRAEATAERAACEKHYATLATTMDNAFRTLGEQLRATSDQQRTHSERNQQWIELLKQQIEKEKEKQRGAS